jgi:hypothetical protein
VLALLRARRERPRGRHAAKQRDELAPFHVATTAPGGLPDILARLIGPWLSPLTERTLKPNNMYRVQLVAVVNA